MKKKLLTFLSKIAPNTVMNYAYRQLTNPQIRKLRESELEILNNSKKEIFEFRDFKIQTYKWKGGKDKILLIHGWEGQAGNFSDIIKELTKNNFSVYAFDGPSHGFSSRGKTSLFEFTELVSVLIEKYKVSQLISHSFGGVATTCSLFNNNLSIEKYVLLTTPDKFSERIDDVCERNGITKKVKHKLINHIEKELNITVSSINVSDFVKKIDVKQAVIIHDKYDKVVPIKQSKNVHANWKTCKFIEVEKTGHFGILKNDSVINLVLEFLKK
ncbi:alpha/beta fold hydrolase [Polaribacter sp. Hel1_85]|uniref:alpha/beta fold hydrolase n=1 Tax=Polaribacter sp. Hel1_85 TaxID=1250005 RepID=UPI00052D29CE|nr:alpha/beta hydrolase [Polaribacter sp. Hel1_85]KGL61749.1 alpha/beta hydrolase family protein [Polaribacter sp. Hel1_85]